jgi:hypothetical protein
MGVFFIKSQELNVSMQTQMLPRKPTFSADTRKARQMTIVRKKSGLSILKQHSLSSAIIWDLVGVEKRSQPGDFIVFALNFLSQSAHLRI